MEKRTREWIRKPVFHGAPISWAQKYFQGRLEKFRKDHKQFDEFLIKINKLIKAENNSDLQNIEKFIDGDGEVNWISPRQSLFDIFIKLFNLCLSPKQAFNYIVECHSIYKKMSNMDYQLCGGVELSIRRSNWDGKESKFISFSVKPKKESIDFDYEYWFDITVSLKIIEEHLNDIKTHINQFDLRWQDEKLEDTLMLFEYYQNKGLLRKVFEAGIEELKEKGIIKEVGQEMSYSFIIHLYDTDLKIGTKQKIRTKLHEKNPAILG